MDKVNRSMTPYTVALWSYSTWFFHPHMSDTTYHGLYSHSGSNVSSPFYDTIANKRGKRGKQGKRSSRRKRGRR